MPNPSLIAVPAEASQTPKIDYEVHNSVGRLLHTFGDVALARKYARRMAPVMGDLTIDAVTTTRKRVTTVRPPKLELVR